MDFGKFWKLIMVFPGPCKFWKIDFWSTRLWKSYGFFVACLAYKAPKMFFLSTLYVSDP
jgi:hypothetical protein